MTTKVLDYFSALVADDDSIPLTETALSIAQDAYPDLDLQAELAAIDVLVARIKNRVADGTPAIQRLRLLNQFFYRELGFGPNANDYYDPENSYLNAVLQSRRGIPISLAVLLMEIGQQIGLMHAHKQRFIARNIAADKSEMLRIIDAVGIDLHPIGTAKAAGDLCFCNRLDKFFLAAAISDEIGNGGDLEAMFLREFHEVGHARHRAIIIHDLADHA